MLAMTSVGTPALWVGFLVFVALMLALDLGVFHKNPHAITLKEAGLWSVAWVTLSLGFNGIVFHYFGKEVGLQFTAAYLLEKALSVDNIFVFVVIFTSLKVAPAYQHRVLFWGVLGALVLRALFIGLGTALVQSFHWVMYVFGAILVFTAGKLLFGHDDDGDPTDNRIFKAFRRLVPMSKDYHQDHFFVREGGKRLATPLLAVLVLVEFTDVLFAVDSIPAVFAVSQDPFIVFTSNIFAILGLRSMYFLLAGVVHKFHLLKVGLAGVLAFVGVKMLIVDYYKVPIAWSLGAIAAMLTLSVVASLVWPKPPETAVEAGPREP